jgi:ribosome assembly protein SQT1
MDEDDEDGDIAAVGDPAGPDTSTAHFASHHPHALFAIAAHPVDPNLIVSGGADDVAYLWRADTGEELVRLTGHTDSVSAVGWSFDGELVATGGMDGRVRIWRRVPPAAGAPAGSEWSRWEFLKSIEDGPDEVTVRSTILNYKDTTTHARTVARLAPQGQRSGRRLECGRRLALQPCAIGSLSTIFSKLTSRAVPSGRQMGVLSSHSTPCTYGAWSPPSSGKRLLTASASPEPTLALWNPGHSLEAPEHRWAFTAQPGADRRFALAGGINCLACNSAGTLGLVGGQADPEDAPSSLRLVSLASGGAPLGSLEGGHDAGSSIEAVAWADISTTVGVWLTAATDGRVCAWDGATGKLRWMAQHEAAVSCLAVVDNAVVVTGSADKTVRAWDLRTGAVVGGAEPRTGHRAVVHALAVTRDGKRVVSGGDDGLGRVHALVP